MTKFTPNEMAKMGAYKAACDEAVEAIGKLYQNATNGEEFSYNTSSDNMLGRGVPEDMMPDLVNAANEISNETEQSVIAAPEATDKGNEAVDKMVYENYGVKMEPEVEENQPKERTSYFIDGVPAIPTETTLQKPKFNFNEYGEIIRGEEQLENDETIPVFVPPEDQEVIETQVSNNGSYKDIVSSAVASEPENETLEPVQNVSEESEQPEKVIEQPEEEEVKEENEESESEDYDSEIPSEPTQTSENVFNPADEIERMMKEMKESENISEAKKPEEEKKKQEEEERNL